ncbi:type II secretion system F family protein [Propionicimonas sp.]|uniref:type II secretion system F family protein n=1 Tax=Propionicimonas sp. TaxID=1955623 RepID=UPI0039E46CC8
MYAFLSSPAALTFGWVLLGLAGLTTVVLVTMPDNRLPLSRRRPGSEPQGSGIQRMANAATDAVEKMLRGRNTSFDAILEEAGVTTPVKDLIVIVGAAALAAFALGLVLGQPVIGLLLALLCPIIGRMLLSTLADRRRKEFGKQLDEVLQMMAGSLRAGYSLPQAVATIAQEAGVPVSQEFARVTNEARVGRSMMDSLNDVATRMRNEDFYWITQAIGINREVGGNLADVLENVSKTIRERTAMKRQVAALAADGKLSAIILMLLPFVVSLFLFISNPGYIMRLFTDPLGWMMLGAGVVMLGIGGFWLTKLINLKY